MAAQRLQNRESAHAGIEDAKRVTEWCSVIHALPVARPGPFAVR
jgi:hypothetical protein